ncbi:mitochondrial ornithine transporter 1 [Contarinia nasturtii]|uniref:mitochondrial ornithine transporter 1 n=1 Tax=Contarinia nasturtii TaxID=265458 RepID=UPI0012D3A133|nr:mitochondrial ornithine transporter 1 [Contarinia nasturtii]
MLETTGEAGPATQVKENGAHFKAGLIDFTAGSLGGIALVYVSQPLDTVKVKMQSFPTLYKNMGDCLLETFKTDGIYRGLYAGTLPSIVANVAENSILFAGYGVCQKFIANIEGHKSVDELSSLSNACAGVIASFFSSFTLCPTELVKCKLQSLREVSNNAKQTEVKHITPFQLTRQIFKQEGILGFYRGLGPTMAREMPGYFCFFGGYEGTRELLRKPDQKKDEIGLLRTMAAGSVGGICLWTAIFPADVIKSRVQIGNIKTNMFIMGMKIARTEGIGALYCGLKPTIIRTIPATAVLFVVYEYSKKFMTQIF